MTTHHTGPEPGRPGSWDEIIVGAGSSGATLAALLARDPHRTVLLLEAGPPDPTGPGETPVLEGANWPYTAYLDHTRPHPRTYPYPLGRTLGGSSAVNGALALRALPHDFHHWTQPDNNTWAWENVLTSYKALENDNHPTHEHNTTGPLPIHRTPPHHLSPLAQAFLTTCATLGLPPTQDLNSTTSPTGAGPLPMNTTNGNRISTAHAHLTNPPPNLHIRTNTTVARILTHAGHATGVQLLDGTHLTAGHVTLSAGAINTPTLLMRSGIGPANHLTTHGIHPIADLPGVGQNLTDHPITALWAIPTPGTCHPGEPTHQVLARTTTGPHHPDLNITLINNLNNLPIPGITHILAGRDAIALHATLLTPHSRGHVTLRDANPTTPPHIDLALLTNPHDTQRLTTGIQLIWQLTQQHPLATHLHHILLWTPHIIENPHLLHRTLTHTTTPAWHPTGTATMGPTTNPNTVVDHHLNVHQLTNLSIVDASIIPTPPSAPTNLTCIMLAHHAATWMRQ